MAVARRDAAMHGITDAMTKSAENFPSRADSFQEYYNRLENTSFSTSNYDFYSKNKNVLTL